MSITNTRTLHGIDLEAPGGIAALLDFHRKSFGDWQMNADADQSGEVPATETPAPEVPKPAAPEPKPTETVEFWKSQAREQEKRAKSNADAAKRLAELEGEAQEKAGQDGEKDSQIAQQQTRIGELEAENTILRTAGKIADLDALLDSKRFTDSLSGIDATDSEAVQAHVEKFVTDNPRYAAQSGRVPGVRDAAWSGRNGVPDPAANAAPGVPRMAAALEEQYSNPK